MAMMMEDDAPEIRLAYWFHEVDDGDLPLCNEHGLQFGWAAPMKLFCEWEFRERDFVPVVSNIHLRIYRGAPMRNLDAEGDAISQAAAASIRRWATTPDGIEKLTDSYDEAVRDAFEDAAEERYEAKRARRVL